MKLTNLKQLVFIILLGIATNSSAQVREYYVYKPGIHYGTMGQFNPMNAVLNGSFDILRNGFDSRRVSNIQFANGFRNINRILGDFGDIVYDFNQVHEHNFWVTQVLPLAWNQKEAAWVPNYQTHIIGEGLICRQLAEWYDHKQAPAPYLWAVMTTFSFQYLNEVVENGPSTRDSVDPIADLMIFNPIGWTLFYFDPIAKFFSDKLHLSNWGLQPMFNPYNQVLSNAGEQFVIKVDLPKTEKYQFFYGWGIDGSGGITYKSANHYNYSVGVGTKANRLKESIRLQQRWVYPEMKPNFVFYIDKEESLLLSVNQTGIDEVNLIINIFPGFLKYEKLGVYFSAKEFLGIHLGLTYNGLPFGLFLGK